MATKADIAELRAEFNERLSQLDSSLSGRLSQLDSKLSKHVGNVETTLGERIAKLETGQKLMFSVFLSLFGGIIAMLVKLVFFP